MSVMKIFDHDSFDIGNCQFPVQIQYKVFGDDIDVFNCMAEIGGGDTTVWAHVDDEYLPVVEKELERLMREGQL